MCLFVGLGSFQALAELPEPDNILYGIISRDGRPVTAADTDVIVEARRTSDGVVVARYRMGDNPRAGDRFILRVPMEVFTPVLDPTSSLAGTPFVVYVSDFGGVIAEVPFTSGARGEMHQLNIGELLGPDSDGDGLLDEWELAWFGNLLQNSGTDKDGDGVTDGQEYVSGSNPNNPNSVFSLHIERTGNDGLEVWFVAAAATGPGYQAKTRVYTLESADDPGNPVWPSVVGYTDVVGADQTVRYPIPDPRVRARFYRVSIQLTELGVPPLP